VEGSPLTNTFKKVIESGILRKLEQHDNFMKIKKRRNFTNLNVLKYQQDSGLAKNKNNIIGLKDSFQSLFIIWGIFLSISCGMLGIEIIVKLCLGWKLRRIYPN
jgi:hypothetical protein